MIAGLVLICLVVGAALLVPHQDKLVLMHTTDK